MGSEAEVGFVVRRISQGRQYYIINRCESVRGTFFPEWERELGRISLKQLRGGVILMIRTLFDLMIEVVCIQQEEVIDHTF